MDSYVWLVILGWISIMWGVSTVLNWQERKSLLDSIRSLFRQNQATVTHFSNLLSTKDPLAFQAVTLANQQNSGYDLEYDPSDEAEIARLRERGISDGAILDEWSDSETDTGSAEFAAVRSELYGE